MPSIALKGLTKSFPAGDGMVAAVDALDLDIRDGEFVTLLGPTGSGKTTILRLIAGKIAPDAGTVRVDGKLLSSSETVTPAEHRGMALVSGHDVIASAPALSGGERQRAALAHALAAEPKVLLLDEPLWNVDARLRERIGSELKEWQRRTGATIVYATHNQAEALALSDQLAIIHAGRLQQVGPPHEIYARPENRQVADITGLVNIIPVTVIAIEGRLCQVEAQRGLKLDIPLPPGVGVGDALDIAIRPENIRLIGGDVGHAKIAGRTFFGHLSEYQASLDTGQMLRVQTHPGQVFAIGEVVEVAIDSMQCTVFRSHP